MTEEQLISKFQTLKQIKPRKDWVILTRSEIFEKTVLVNKVIKNKITYGQLTSNIFGSAFQRKFSYALASFVLVVAGVAGFTNFYFSSESNIKISQQSAAALVEVKSNIETLKEKSKTLAEVSKSNSQDAVSLAIKEVKTAAKNITETITKNPKLVSKIALDVNNNKTYLDVAGGNNLSEVSDMYRAIITQELKDLNGKTLTSDQKLELERIKTFFSNGDDYATVLRDILFINASRDSKI